MSDRPTLDYSTPEATQDGGGERFTVAFELSLLCPIIALATLILVVRERGDEATWAACGLGAVGIVCAGLAIAFADGWVARLWTMAKFAALYGGLGIMMYLRLR